MVDVVVMSLRITSIHLKIIAFSPSRSFSRLSHNNNNNNNNKTENTKFTFCETDHIR